MASSVKEKVASGIETGDDALSVQICDLDSQEQPTEWTPEEEKRLVRKIDLLLMPLLVTGFFALQLNRGNIAFALTDGFFQSGIYLPVVPERIGSPFDRPLLLGIAMGGFIPASLYTLTMWYKISETSTRFSIFFMGNTVARAVSGLVSYGILQMRGVAGLAGWRWLMILDGILSVAAGIMFALLFPSTPASPRSLCHLRFLTEREAWVADRRVLLNDPTKSQKRHSVSWGDIVSTLKNWPMYPHLVIALLGNAPSSALGSYGPTIINSMGYGALASNVLTSVGSWIQLFLGPVFGVLAYRTRRRAVIAGIFANWQYSWLNRRQAKESEGNEVGETERNYKL
ncbi:hypothetical protein AK830_g2487 [Neonectria ditissima]|uniref:Major facilitator superfamily (MFS) profile domain-containing protein n=1 Tax=Neonectria ditissima TaxID=78410 RepID=A0A0P7BK50_9HYPO|nr:hypothetical protein AK830_g2487 [Neonectria ditissima]